MTRFCFGWRLGVLLLLSILAALHISPASAVTDASVDRPQPPYPQGEAIPYPRLSELKTTAELQKRFHEHAKNTTDVERLEAVRSALKANAGIYKHPSFNLMRGVNLSKTVLITLLAINNDINQYYNDFLENFLCFSEAHHLSPIIYVKAFNSTVLEERIKYLQSRSVSAFSYPDSLFWQVVANKTNEVFHGKKHARYDKDEPDFQNFGALVQLIPALEVLYFGYNVVFLDIDVAMVRDPIPFIVRGQADLTMSMEPRNCQDYYSSAYPEFFDWTTGEPNTGVMHLRATKLGVTGFRRFVDRLVFLNYLNDQLAFQPKEMGLVFDGSCHSSSYVDPGDPRSAMKASPTLKMVTSSSDATYCYLDELLFQNGRIGVKCSHPTSSFRDEWIAQMHKSGIHDSISSAARYPAILHVNYVSNKLHELRVRGLWLMPTESPRQNLSSYDNPYCLSYDHRNSYYGGTINWTAEVSQVLSKRQLERDAHIRNGTLIKAVSSASVYYISENLTRHLIPNLNTFNFMFGGDFSIVKAISTNVMLSVPEGLPIPEAPKPGMVEKQQEKEDVRSSNPSTRNDRLVDKPISFSEVFALRANRSRDESRYAAVLEILSSATGIYRPTSSSLRTNSNLTSQLAQSVLVAVYQGTWEDMVSADLLQNFLCFLEVHHLKVLLYIFPSSPSSPSSHADRLALRSRGLYIVTYPEHLFWTALAARKTMPTFAEETAFYSSVTPSVAAYGQVALLVPLLEVLRHGYHVISLDVNTLLLHDPIPYLVQSTADITLMMESRECEEIYSSHFPTSFDWDRVEPNLGILSFRASPQSVQALQHWVDLLVQENRLLAKKAFPRKMVSLHHSPHCQGASGSDGEEEGKTYPSAASEKGHAAHLSHSRTNKASSSATYCFLDDLLFSSSIGAECEQVHFRDEWILQMIRRGLTVENGSARYPVAVHLAGIEDRRTHLQEQGLWLARNLTSWIETSKTAERCHVWTPESTVFGRLDWESEQKATLRRREQMERTYIRNGNLVKSLTRSTVYYIDEKLTRHVIADRNTLGSLQGGRTGGGAVKSLPHSVIAKLPLGKPLVSHPSQGGK